MEFFLLQFIDKCRKSWAFALFFVVKGGIYVVNQPDLHVGMPKNIGIN